ncbi:YopX family protein [Staphylococcus equorum]|uniref:YopX protein domain-containing protein n=1 Tax=Staphylococcus equorum TaxID=246432 RepID=A0AAP7LV22_9STAP|nr:YopX family protein [Staphylococcus equorum]OEK58910.1 hypothetical protein ASS94_00885 [Staphylococcus equorum]
MIPKFQAFIKEKGLIVPVQEINFKYEEIVWESGEYKEVAKFEDIELLQSTGVNDAHDREYFNKDIARDIDSEELGVIEYENGMFIMRFKDSGVDLIDVHHDFEIIGNQFLHSDILEKL